MVEVTQIAYCTHDIEATARAFAEFERVGPFYFAEFPLFDLTYRGEPVDYGKLKAAFSYRGSLQVELLQAPAGAHSIYSEGLEGRREVFHHTFVKTAEDYDAIVARYEAGGERLIYNGLAGDDRIRFGYIDARARLGHFVEVLETNKLVGPAAMILTLYERMEVAARNWDGERPIRPMEELI